MNMTITKEKLVKLINEELTRTDKTEIKKMIDDAIEKGVKRDLGEIAKSVIKKLYKDLSFHHPYIIDRIKI